MKIYIINYLLINIIFTVYSILYGIECAQCKDYSVNNTVYKSTVYTVE